MNAVAPATARNANAPPPTYATCRRPFGAWVPPIAATSATTGSANTAAVVVAQLAASPDPTRPGERPDLTRIPYWIAVAAAPPPGITLPAAPAASCDVPTANQLRVRSATRCSVQSAM